MNFTFTSILKNMNEKIDFNAQKYKDMTNPKSLSHRLKMKYYQVLMPIINSEEPDKNIPDSDIEELNEIRKFAKKKTDISDHLELFFAEALTFKPKTIVEMGVRGGDSTFVLERVAKLCNSSLLSIDIEDCSDSSTYENWKFVQMDDLKFAKKYPEWCKENNVAPEIDVLFIDTSHFYEHTVLEIEYWFPYLSENCKVFFHDTNMEEVYKRKDGSIGFGWDNQRGVIQAIEEYLGTKYNEKHDFIDVRSNWVVKHHAICNGFTIMERI